MCIRDRSFTPSVRFSKDSIKSPQVPNRTTVAASPNQFIRFISGANQANACEEAKARINPPKKPSHDFLGEIRSNNLCFPIKEPTKYAPVSSSQTKIKIAMIKSGV